MPQLDICINQYQNIFFIISFMGLFLLNNYLNYPLIIRGMYARKKLLSETKNMTINELYEKINMSVIVSDNNLNEMKINLEQNFIQDLIKYNKEFSFVVFCKYFFMLNLLLDINNKTVILNWINQNEI